MIRIDRGDKLDLDIPDRDYGRSKLYSYTRTFCTDEMSTSASSTFRLASLLRPNLARRFPLRVPAASYASIASEQPSLSQAPAPFEVFDRVAKRKQKDRAATRIGQDGSPGGNSRVTDYLKDEVADRMFERFEASVTA